VVFLVAGDPLIATTHVDLRLRAETQGIKTRIIHGVSIISAVIGISGLQNYKFGKSVTVPFDIGVPSFTSYNVIMENKARNLHTLCFLDIRAEEMRFMTIKEALEILLKIEETKKRSITSPNSLAIGIARVGDEDVIVKAENIKALNLFNFGLPPHILIFPSEKLHFMEAEALIRFANAPLWIRKMII
jgi:diphthine synthase